MENANKWKIFTVTLMRLERLSCGCGLLVTIADDDDDGDEGDDGDGGDDGDDDDEFS